MPLLSTAAGRLIVLVIGTALSFAISVAGGGALVGLLGATSPVAGMAATSACLAAQLLMLSGWLLQREGDSLASLGLPTSRRRLLEFAFGALVSAFVFAAVAVAQSAMVGAAWEFQSARGVAGAAVALIVTACMVLAEELVFRGMLLRGLRQALGDRNAIAFTAILFGLYHVALSNDWAVGALFRFGTSALGGLLFAWAAVRSNGLALPLGLHLGGNWVQAGIAGFSPAGDVPALATLFRITITPGDLQVLMAPDVGPRLPYFTALLLAAIAAGWFVRRSPRT